MPLVPRLISVGFEPHQARHIGYDLDDNITATGNDSQGTGYALTANINLFTTVGATTNSATLMELEECPAAFVYCVNTGANTLNVFPASGESINQQAVNTKIQVASGGSCLLFAALDKWIGGAFA